MSIPDDAVSYRIAVVMPRQDGDPPDRIRVVVTDVEVEQDVLFDHRGNETDPVWREVQS